MPTALKTKRQASPRVKRVPTLVVARLIGLQGTSQAMISVGDDSVQRLLRARIATPLGREHIGRDVVVFFENGETRHPVVMGVVAPWPLQDSPKEADKNAEPAQDGPRDMAIDGERLLLTAEREIVLTCGKSSLTLTRAGKVLIKGTYLSSRSSGVHRIKGGSVQVN
jgi:hypothetical protein